jgi:hypothetical protein
MCTNAGVRRLGRLCAQHRFRPSNAPFAGQTLTGGISMKLLEQVRQMAGVRHLVLSCSCWAAGRTRFFVGSFHHPGTLRQAKKILLFIVNKRYIPRI